MNNLHHNRFGFDTGTGTTNDGHLLIVFFHEKFKRPPIVNAIASGENTHDVNIDISTVTASGCVIHSSAPAVDVMWQAMGDTIY